MSGYFYNFVFQRKFIKSLRDVKSLSCFLEKNFKDSGQRFFSRGKIHKQSFSVPAFRCKKFVTNEAPLVLLSSGILTFLGLKEKTPEEKESELIMTIKRGIWLMQREQYDKSEQMLHLALKLAQDQNDEEGVTYVYDVLANLAFERGQHQKAEKLFVNVLQRLLAKGEDEESNKVVHISLKLAKIFEDTKEYKKADQGYKFCIETLDKKLQEDDEDTLALWGMSMDWYARFLLGINKKNEALNCFKKAYDMCVQVNGLEHEQTVVLLNDLGTVSSLIGDTDSALSYFEKAKDIGDKLPEMKDLAAIYINLGQLYLLREMYNESKMACQEGLNRARKFEDETGLKEAKQCLDKINKLFSNQNQKKDSGYSSKVLVN